MERDASCLCIAREGPDDSIHNTILYYIYYKHFAIYIRIVDAIETPVIPFSPSICVCISISLYAYKYLAYIYIHI